VRPKVTVVITTRDRLAYLREAVASVREQHGVAHELVIVDNGSADETPGWLASLDEPGVTTLRIEHDPQRSRAANISVARNAGLDRARGQYVWFLDDDDRLRPGALALLATALDRHPTAIAAVGARTRFADGVSMGRVSHPLRRVVRDMGGELLLGWSFIPGQTLCRESTLSEVGRWREDVPYSEDLELWARVLPHGPVVLEPQTVLEYRVHRAQSRLADPVSLHDLLMRPHVAQLARGDRRRGETLREAGRWWERANLAFNRQEPGRALAWTLRAVFLAPRLLTSPAVGPLAMRMIVRSALRLSGPLGRWATARALRPAGAKVRRGTGYLS
jgi:hypothetical protein